MEMKETILQALRATRDNKLLWGFGLLAGGLTHPGGGKRSGVESAAQQASGMPPVSWIVVVLVIAATALLAHLISEGALIAGLRPQHAPRALRPLLRAGLARAWPILLLKLAGGAVWGLSAAVVLAPLWSVRHDWLSHGAAVLLGVPLVLIGIPWLLTLTFIYLYALRFIVLHDQGVVQAVRNAKLYLHGRIADSLRLMLVDFGGLLAGVVTAALVAAPGALAGLALHAAGATSLAWLLGVSLALPLALTAMGATGTFRSSVWTLAFLEGRG